MGTLITNLSPMDRAHREHPKTAKHDVFSSFRSNYDMTFVFEGCGTTR